MKILYVIPTYEPAWAAGGTVTATSQLCRALARQNIDVTVYTTDADGKGGRLDVLVDEEISIGGVKVWYFTCNMCLKNAFHSKNLTLKLKETIENFDIIHVSAIWQWIQVDVATVCKKYRKPYIVSPHGSYSPWPFRHNSFKKIPYWLLFGKKTAINSAAIHFTAEEERKKCLELHPFLSKISNFAVPNGIEFTKIVRKDNQVRRHLNIPDDKFIILHIGRVHQKKGIHFVMEALRKLNNEKFIFMIIGNNEDTEYINELKRLEKGTKNLVIWVDQVPSDRVWDYYFSSNIFALPSYDENFGMVVVEAMACGLPVLISKNVGIWREVQEDNAGFIIEQDSNEIAAVLQKILENPELVELMGKNAIKSAEKRYDIKNTANLMIKAYEDVLTGRRSPELQWK